MNLRRFATTRAVTGVGETSVPTRLSAETSLSRMARGCVRDVYNVGILTLVGHRSGGSRFPEYWIAVRRVLRNRNNDQTCGRYFCGDCGSVAGLSCFSLGSLKVRRRTLSRFVGSLELRIFDRRLGRGVPILALQWQFHACGTSSADRCFQPQKAVR